MSTEFQSDSEMGHFSTISARGSGLKALPPLPKKNQKLKITGEISPGTSERLLSALANSRRRGSLAMTSTDQNVRLEVLRGSLLVLDAGHPQHRLGFLALQENLISSQQLLAALKLQSTTDTNDFLGRLLLERAGLEERALRWVLHKQAKLVVESIETWKEGFFTFEEHNNSELDQRSPVLDERLDLERFVHRVGHTRGY